MCVPCRTKADVDLALDRLHARTYPNNFRHLLRCGGGGGVCDGGGGGSVCGVWCVAGGGTGPGQCQTRMTSRGKREGEREGERGKPSDLTSWFSVVLWRPPAPAAPKRALSLPLSLRVFELDVVQSQRTAPDAPADRRCAGPYGHCQSAGVGSDPPCLPADQLGHWTSAAGARDGP